MTEHDILIDKIRGVTDLFPNLIQLAEEATELAQAALKIVRSIETGFPPMEEYDHLFDNLIEEYTDVRLVADVIRIAPNETVYREKANRWIARMMNISE